MFFRGEGFKRKNSWRFYVSFEDEEVGANHLACRRSPAFRWCKLKWADIDVDIDALKRGEHPSVLEDSILGLKKRAIKSRKIPNRFDCRFVPSISHDGC